MRLAACATLTSSCTRRTGPSRRRSPLLSPTSRRCCNEAPSPLVLHHDGLLPCMCAGPDDQGAQIWSASEGLGRSSRDNRSLRLVRRVTPDERAIAALADAQGEADALLGR